MENRSQKSRPVVKLSPLIDQRLASYTLAARAAGVGILALAGPAEGKIVYTPTHHLISRGGSFKLDLNHDGITDFTFQNRFMTNCSTITSGLSVKPAAGNGAKGWTGFRPYAFAIKQGARIGPGQYFVGQELASVDAGPGGIYYPGSWQNVKNRFLGLQFKIKGKTHYGWARLSVTVQSYQVTGTLTGYAYETLPNKAIVAGQTDETQQVSVEPDSLGRLAAGASAVWKDK